MTEGCDSLKALDGHENTSGLLTADNLTRRWSQIFSEGSQIRTPISYFKAKCHLDRRPLPKQSYQKLILQISVLLLPEEDCSTVLDLPSLTKSYKSYKEKRKSPGRSVVSRQYHSFSSYSFSPLMCFLLLFVFSSYSFSPFSFHLLSHPFTSLSWTCSFFQVSNYEFRTVYSVLFPFDV